MDFKRRYIVHPRNTGKTRVTYASHIMKLVLNYINTGDVSFKAGHGRTRQDTAGLVGVTGDRGGAMAYEVLNQLSAMMETWDEFRQGSAESDEDSRYIEVLEEIYNVLDALAGWCAKECWIGSGNYGNRRGIRVESEGYDVSIREDTIKLTPTT